MKRYVVSALAVAGIVAAIVFMYAQDAPEPDPTSPLMLEADGSPSLGDPDAPLTMIEWGDYQCTFCYRFHQHTFDTLKNEYVQTGILRVVFRDFPLNGPDSVLAAHAAKCADEQGFYWQYHDTLYNNWGGERTGWITEDALYGFALDTGLQSRLYTDCMESEKYMTTIQDDYESSRQIGIDATPSFIIHDTANAIKITGNQPIETFHAVIQELHGDR